MMDHYNRLTSTVRPVIVGSDEALDDYARVIDLVHEIEGLAHQVEDIAKARKMSKSSRTISKIMDMLSVIDNEAGTERVRLKRGFGL